MRNQPMNRLKKLLALLIAVSLIAIILSCGDDNPTPPEDDPTDYSQIPTDQISFSVYGDSVPMDSFSLNFAKIEYEYKPQK